MIGYNYAASRYVVSVGEASSIDAAIRTLAERRASELEAEPRQIASSDSTGCSIASTRSTLIKLAAEAFARMIERLRMKASRRALASLAEVLGELAAVNVFGVPGAGLESVTRRERISPRTSLRHASLFVASWFAGARLLGAILGVLYTVPVLGAAIATITSTIGAAFDTLTDVRHPIGAIAVTLVVVAVIRYSRAVERVAASMP